MIPVRKNKIPIRKLPDIYDIGYIVQFDKSSHSYYIHGKQYISVTTLIKKYCPVFDPDGSITKRCAERKGITPEEMRKEWDSIKDAACERGTNFHSEAEHWIKTREFIDGEFKEQIKDFSKFRPKEKLYSEAVLYSRKYGVAGTSDLIQLFKDNSVVVMDWKTNKRFDSVSRFGNHLSAPISELGDSHLELYSLQLWCYAIMLEEFGFKIRDMPIVLWLNPSGVIEQIKCLDLKSQPVRMMEHYRDGEPCPMQPWEREKIKDLNPMLRDIFMFQMIDKYGEQIRKYFE